MRRFVIVKPTARDGHETTVIETRPLLEEWVSGIDFSGMGGYVVGVEDTVTKTEEAFWAEINRQLEESSDPDRDIEIRYIPQMAGG